MNVTQKTDAYRRGLAAGFAGSVFSSSTEETQTDLDEWQNGWCDAHEIRVSLGKPASERLSSRLQNLS